MIVHNAKVFTKQGTFVTKDIYIENGIFTESSNDKNTIDAKGAYAVPGLIDIHLHGCNGHDFCEGTMAALRCMTKYEVEHGITTIVPASMTLPESRLIEVFEKAAEWKNLVDAEIAGIYMEGPFVSLDKKGAQNDLYIMAPDENLLDRLITASNGLVRFVAVAPETENAINFIEKYSKELIITIAHTSADYDITNAAIAAGARQITHLFNAMNSVHHREPGPIIAASEHNEVMVELICDGVHIHPAIVRGTFKLFNRDRIIFVSDSMMAAGMPDGEYELGGQIVKVKGRLALLKDGITIAGSATDLMECVRTAVHEMGIPLEDAIWCATVNPAKAAGIFDKCGSIETGKIADLVLLDNDLNIINVYKRGTLI